MKTTFSLIKKRGIGFIWILLFFFIFALNTHAEPTSFQSYHQNLGLECNTCHVDNDTTVLVQNEQCLTCHQPFEQLALQTSDMSRNPHKNPHFLDLDCTSCHIGHDQRESICESCHAPITRNKK